MSLDHWDRRKRTEGEEKGREEMKGNNTNKNTFYTPLMDVKMIADV